MSNEEKLSEASEQEAMRRIALAELKAMQHADVLLRIYRGENVTAEEIASLNEAIGWTVGIKVGDIMGRRWLSMVDVQGFVPGLSRLFDGLKGLGAYLSAPQRRAYDLAIESSQTGARMLGAYHVFLKEEGA